VNTYLGKIIKRSKINTNCFVGQLFENGFESPVTKEGIDVEIVNDTIFNNPLFDLTGEKRCIIFEQGGKYYTTLLASNL
jgi:hypothetical protein